MNRASGRGNGRMRGAASVEMALVSLLFYSMMFGVVYAAIVMFAWNSAAYAARQATRYAMVHGAASGYACTSAQLQSMVRRSSGLQSATVTTTWTPNNSPGSTVKVFVSMPVAVFVPLVSIKSVTVASSSQMIILQ